jgi:exopolysaccharide production protein ExoQ
MRGADRLVLNLAPSVLLAMLAVLSLVFVPLLGGLGAMGFLGFGLILVFRRPWALVAELRAWRLLYLLPGWCLLSVLWSAEPALTFRYSLQLGATFLIVIAMACRLSPLSFFRVMLGAYVMAALASVAFGTIRADGGGWIGIFGSKNAFATAMSVLVLAGLSLALDRGRGLIARLAGLGAVGAGAVLLGLGQSAGASLATLLVGGFGAGIYLLRRLSWQQKRAAALLCGAVALTLSVVVLAERAQIMALVLQGTGKDVTLTGRTDLWSEALRQIASAPLLGQGYQAFWVQGHAVAEQLWADFDIKSRSGFHFHNLYLSNTVEIGLIGIAVQLATFYSALWLCLIWAVRTPQVETVFLAMLMLRLAVISFVEVPVYFQFDMNTVFAVAALVFGLRAREAWRAGSGRAAAARVERPGALPRSPGIFMNN